MPVTVMTYQSYKSQVINPQMKTQGVHYEPLPNGTKVFTEVSGDYEGVIVGFYKSHSSHTISYEVRFAVDDESLLPRRIHSDWIRSWEVTYKCLSCSKNIDDGLLCPNCLRGFYEV